MPEGYYKVNTRNSGYTNACIECDLAVYIYGALKLGLINRLPEKPRLIELATLTQVLKAGTLAKRKQ